MSRMRVLLTGGAGFIGSHLARQLVAEGADLVVFDSFEAQVHSDERVLLPPVELIQGDVTDPDAVARALNGVTHVVHFAAAVGVGQSMYQIARYCRTNVLGTAVLLEALAGRARNVHRLLVASSMSVYGEGAVRCGNCVKDWEIERDPSDLAAGCWELRCPVCRSTCSPLPTAETKAMRPASVYAVSKRDQEELCLVVGRAYGIPTVALRFFNVYGPGQALGNPYTGVAAIFSARLLAASPPLIFEDGLQTRDFVHVADVARACVLALTCDGPDQVAINVGSGRRTTVLEVARILQTAVGGPGPELLKTFRPGDIRHCMADGARARTLLGWEPNVSLEDGLKDLAAWLASQRGYAERLDHALSELRRHGLVRRPKQ